ncbi:hypothetical protein FXO37_24911 [Capsicum annuum]|nr:hypothetical protein FXO37_24911 [Capsicum annuum]
MPRRIMLAEDDRDEGPWYRRSISVSKAISMVLASGVFLVAVTILCQRYLPHLPINKYPVNSSDIISIRHQSMESSELPRHSVSRISRNRFTTMVIPSNNGANVEESSSSANGATGAQNSVH